MAHQVEEIADKLGVSLQFLNTFFFNALISPVIIGEVENTVQEEKCRCQNQEPVASLEDEDHSG